MKTCFLRLMTFLRIVSRRGCTCDVSNFTSGIVVSTSFIRKSYILVVCLYLDFVLFSKGTPKGFCCGSRNSLVTATVYDTTTLIPIILFLAGNYRL